MLKPLWQRPKLFQAQDTGSQVPPLFLSFFFFWEKDQFLNFRTQDNKAHTSKLKSPSKQTRLQYLHARQGQRKGRTQCSSHANATKAAPLTAAPILWASERCPEELHKYISTRQRPPRPTVLSSPIVSFPAMVHLDSLLPPNPLLSPFQAAWKTTLQHVPLSFVVV